MLAQPAENHSPAPPGPMFPQSFEVSSRRQETADTWTLELKPPRASGFAFAPGQFTMISAGGAGEVPISISGDPGEPGVLVHTVRAVGLATEALCASQPGQILSVRGPFGAPWPVQDLEGADVVVAAGGIGLAPLRPALLSLLAARGLSRRLILLYGGRAPDQLLFQDELESWAGRGMEVLVTVDSAGPEWLGHVGVVTRLVRRAAIDGDRAVALLCGPEIMMRFMAAALTDQGMPGSRIYASMERNMQCGIGHCGHCQLGPTLVCRDGPVYRWDELEPWLAIKEL
jgi:NAD(P)H-flavin reductase